MGILKPRTATVTLYQGDDLEHLAELRREVAYAERAAEQAQGTPRRDGDAVVSATAEQEAYDAFVDEAAGRAVLIHIAAIGSTRFNALLAEHPPRREKDADGRDVVVADDDEYGVNMATFPRALLVFADDGKRTIIGPPEAVESVEEFIDDDVSAGQMESLFDAAYWLNRTRGVDPKVTTFSTGSPSLSEN